MNKSVIAHRHRQPGVCGLGLGCEVCCSADGTAAVG